MSRHRIDILVNAAHPFAGTMAGNALQASRETGVPLLRLRRDPWKTGTGSSWCPVSDLAAAAGAIEPGDRVFAALGSKGARALVSARAAYVLVRTVDPVPRSEQQPGVHYVTGLPDPSRDGEAALLRAHAITVLVVRNSGGAQGFAKVAAAESLGVRIIMIERPPEPEMPRVRDVDAAVAWIDSRHRQAPL